MGHIKTIELSNGNIGLDITYGGKECPFGGVDTSAPPAYIDPKCFTDCDGFIIVDDKLVAVNMAPADAPTLWSGTAGVNLIGFGNFYSTKYGTLNYALGYTAIDISGTPTGVQYTFYMTAWSPSNPATYWNDTLVETLYNSVSPATAASITMALATTGSATPGSGATVVITDVTTHQGGPDIGCWVTVPGIITGITVTGGTGYALDSIYWVQQGDNITAQVKITALGAGNSVAGVSIVPDTFSTATISSTYQIEAFASAGFNYTPIGISSSGSATLVYIEEADVQLQVSGPAGGPVMYTTTSNGVTQQVPNPTPAPTFPPADTTTPGAFVISAIVDAEGYTTDPSRSGAIYSFGLLYSGGLNFTVGEMYFIQEYTDAKFTTAIADGTAILLITDVGVGGSIDGFSILNPGTFSSGYVAGSTVYGINLTTAVPINVLESTELQILNALALEINTDGVFPDYRPDNNVIATVNLSADTLTLTARAPGTTGNLINVQDFSTITGTALYYYYFPARTLTYLTGGDDGTGSGTVLSTVLPLQASIAPVGGTLYIGNIGPMIIKYSGPGSFVVSSTLLGGVRVLRKFANSLIGLGMVQPPGGYPAGTVVQNTDMIFLWTAAAALDVWSPLDLSSNITGAGYNQLADIGDYLTGLVVSSGTAFILRAQGISYATATGNATQPFNWSHIGLGDQGEGSQVASLVCQYDHIGAYVGNTNIYQISQTITAIGTKIKALLLNGADTEEITTSTACSSTLGGDTITLFDFITGSTDGTVTMFIYTPANAAWMLVKFPVEIGTSFSTIAVLKNVILGVLASANTFASTLSRNMFKLAQCVQSLSVNTSTEVSTLSAPVLYTLQEGVKNANSISNGNAVTFPQEEIAFGRDITIDGLYVALFASVTEDIIVAFYISGVYFNSLILTSAQFNTLGGAPVELQLTSQTGSFTVHSPQLSYVVNSITDTGTAQIRFTKFAMFGSFDPKQRPV